MNEIHYTVPATLSRMEVKVVQHLRSLQNHGYGRLEVQFEGGHVVNVRRMFADDPTMLKRLQSEDEGEGALTNPKT